MVIPFSIEMDAPIEVLWAKINNWAGDISWVKDAKVCTAGLLHVRCQRQHRDGRTLRGAVGQD